MTQQSRSPGLQAALEERDNIKIQIHLLQENGAGPDELLAARQRVAELDRRIHEMRQGLVAEPLARRRRAG